MPKRIQRKRTKGWKMPDGAVYVGRPTKWGNPFVVVDGDYQRPTVTTNGGSVFILCESVAAARKCAVSEFRAYAAGRRFDLTPLRGKDLACWCQLDQPCHADVLLELANAEPIS